MSSDPETSPAGDRVRAYRERMRSLGLRPILSWVPDVRTPEFAAEARRQSLLIAALDEEDGEDQSFIEAISDYED